MTAPHFYVYVHRRADSGLPFYVGKGSGARARVEQHRNPHWQAIASKAGYSVHIAAQHLDEELAHLAEVELIAKLRAIGVRLTNMTDGGEGMAGYRMSADTLRRRSEKQTGQKRPTVSAKLKGRFFSPEHREKLRAARLGRTWSEEAKAEMSLSRAGRPGPMLGRKQSEEAKRKISESLRARNAMKGGT